MINNENTKEVIRLIPESFYDLLAYVLPGIYLVFDVLVVLGIVTKLDLVGWFQHEFSWITVLLFSVLMFGVFYYIGLVLTTISFYLIQEPCSMVLEKLLKRKRTDFHFDLFQDIPLLLKNMSSPVNAELIKIYARLNLARNISMVSVISLILLFFKWNTKHITTSTVILAVSIVCVLIRSKWLRLKLDVVDSTFKYLIKEQIRS